MSGHARTIGPLKWTFQEAVDDPMNAALKGVWQGQAEIGLGTLNAIYDNTATTGLQAVLASPAKRTVLVAVGMEAAPVAFVPAFCGQFNQADYPVMMGESPVTATIAFSDTNVTASNTSYASPWGVLLHPLGAETGASTATGDDGGAQTTTGGFMCYHVTAGNGTATLKVQDASTNADGSFADLLTSGSIDCSSVKHGIVTLATTATVKRYTRFQIALGTATSVTFVLAFCRNYYN